MGLINAKWLTIDDLAAYLKMGKTKLYTMAQRGNIPRQQNRQSVAF